MKIFPLRLGLLSITPEPEQVISYVLECQEVAIGFVVASGKTLASYPVLPEPGYCHGQLLGCFGTITPKIRKL
jgi:hypothetical protein